MKKLAYILLLMSVGCDGLVGFEDVVTVELPDEQNLVVVEGWITDRSENQTIRLTRSNNFAGEANPSIQNASVRVETLTSGTSYTYRHTQNGTYQSDSVFQGIRGEEYRLIVLLSNGDEIQSNWSRMLPKTEIVLLSVDSFIDNDPENPGQNVTIYFPRITARDSAGFQNFYRWIFFKNGERLTDPESITLQDDLFFDGNFIPNSFEEFQYRQGDLITVELHSINQDALDFLDLLKAQITTLGSSTSTTPANVVGNLRNITNPEQTVLGYFGSTAISSASETAEN